MGSYSLIRKFSYGAILITSLLACAVSNAGRGVGGGGAYHGGVDNNYHGDYNNRNDNYNRGIEGSSGVIIGAPIGGDIEPAYPDSCQTVQQCDSDGNCVQTQNCN